jgi:hypothetical protein
MNKATDAKKSGLQKPDINIVYESLCVTCDILDSIGCKYFLAGGTLLGANREGDLIAHDTDFDLDCLIEDEGLIFDAEEKFIANGLTIRKKLSMTPRRFETLEPTTSPLYSSCILVEYRGFHVGDICIFTIFSDGIARRFEMNQGIYFNPKMSLPGWYYSGETKLSIRGRMFNSVREPNLVLEKVYGEDWQTPLLSGQFKEGRDRTSGSVTDADLEKLVLRAHEMGWPSYHPGKPSWPQIIQWVGWPALTGKQWIWRHEPKIRPELNSLIEELVGMTRPEEMNASMLTNILTVVAARSIQSESNRLNGLKNTERRLPLLNSVLKLIPLPPTLKSMFKKSYRLFFSRRS